MNRRLLASALALTLAGCGGVLHRVQPDRKSPVALPDAFSRGAGGEPSIGEAWWQALGDGALDRLCRAALEGNLDLRRAAARIAAAEAVSKSAGAMIWPQLQLETSVSRSRQNLFLGQAVAFEVTNFPVSLAASYEVDLWGRVASTRKAAELDARATADDLAAARISVTGAVADAWYAVVGERATLALLDAQAEVNKQLVELVEVRFGAGLAAAIDVLQQRGQLEAVLSQRPAAEGRLALAEQRLTMLLGGVPGGKAPELPDDAKVPEPAPLPPLGVPATLLARRPDVRAARRRMLAVDHRVVAASAELLPAIRLSASTGFQGRSSERQDAIFFENWVWNLFSGLTAPLWDGGRRKAEVERTKALLADAVAGYGQVVQRAMTEVEEALVRDETERRSLAAVDRRLDIARKTLEEARFRYAHGQTDYLPVLTTLAALQNLEQERLARLRAALTVRVGLLRALAGAPGDA
ncbi:MAG: hypothetical protein RIT45_2233 [Pseudomonadota bacterium]|jgi:NodT family efflux transporter outer membrane factor (OMF) lipoprotein